ncbi:CRISPR-associated helicase Cas3' [Planomonospora corallina]|uniref:CRISPR-associated helicase Cas3 n=1 Tax=Planomonospora corallina TaxID=1806052 RepID=A0ABV8I0C9_9ACTN
MDEPPDVDLMLWGKSRGLPARYPLVCHLLDAAAAVEVLWDDYLAPGLRTALAGELVVGEERARRLLAYWAGLHDIGKCMSCFQEQDGDGFSGLVGYPEVDGEAKSHAFAAHVWLGRMLAGSGYTAKRKWSAAIRVAQLLGGHHGAFSSFHHLEFRDPLGALPALGEGRWEEQRRAIATAVHELMDRPEPPPEVSAAGGALACAVVILADWLVSQDAFLRRRIDAGLPRHGDITDLQRHLAGSRAAVVPLLREAGLGRLTFKPGGFSEDFPFQPNDLQRSISERLPVLVGGEPGLLLIMAPMGEGKTEAALHGGRLMGEAAGMPGCFVGLPTMATSDQMLRRVDDFRARRAEGADSLTLLHGMAWLNTAYSPDGGEARVLTDDPMATRWLRGSKRGLLANLAVGTIDQALLAVLRGRHNVLRMLGLVGKVLVIDEVHAYDAYMQGLLKVLLEWLGALKVPVVLLSATLPVAVGRRLAEAYLKGAGCREQKVPEVTYPGWIYVSPQAAQATAVASRERILRVESHRVPIGRDGRLDRSAALQNVLTPVADEGGCAAVICNTVAEAQHTYLALRDWIRQRGGAQVPEIRLLHSRFPAYRREEITQEMVGWFGKDAAGHRPRAAILVATQVIEQSLDLDFDVVVSDLAPIALLLQRAGRCQRHPVNDTRRPGWAVGMRLVVLTPADARGELVVPRAWPFVYPTSLLRRTHDALMRLDEGAVAIPGAIQALVDEVYDEDFGNEVAPLTDDDVSRLADEQTKDLYARMAAIPAPEDVEELSQLSGDDFINEFSTRLGAESGRVVCCTVGADGRFLLDGERLPETGTSGSGNKRWFSKEQVRLVMRHTIPVPGTWLRGLSADNAPPAAWADSAHLSDLTVVTMSGQQPSGQLGQRQVWLSPELGLAEFPATPS